MSLSFRNHLRRRLKPHYVRFQQWMNQGLYAVNICGIYGFFAHMSSCLQVFAHCQRHGLRPYIILSSPLYLSPGRGGNWFDYFFEAPTLLPQDKDRIASGRISVSRVTHWRELGLPCYTEGMALEDGHDLIARHMRIRDEIRSHVDSFVDSQFAGKAVLGVHYRGTDKTSEAPRVPWDTVRQAVCAYLNDHLEIAALYVASDERAFIDWSLRTFDFLHVIIHPDEYRSCGSLSVHEDPAGDRFTKGKEALVNALLLSRCAGLVRTASRLSAWSCVFNPQLPVITLNEPEVGRDAFPEAAVIRKSMGRYVRRP